MLGGALKTLNRYLATALALFSLWLLFTSTVRWQETAAGAVFALLVAALGYEGFTDRGLRMLHPRRVLHLLVYLPVFFWEMIKANFDVAYRVIHPRMPIRPGIVAIRTSLKTDVGKLLLANSITLTPGTLTMEVREEHLFIHWINVRDADIEKASEIIAGRFEKHLKAICE
jgi:multicomponent Na+:H+ antiporter subunit E